MTSSVRVVSYTYQTPDKRVPPWPSYLLYLLYLSPFLDARMQGVLFILPAPLSPIAAPSAVRV